ncbi:hypothetical protein [Methanonatronarchaeum sp. AMET-Sl]|uniref:hypothetical protein n=1 Tax=Methanonatronarchaeum sp. AMET-Sl TaxID=3037654 RepID=UPI00244DB01C|nr:hypothetical protein [Methanonatronarchaeum sp. AMET-Sl]WGI17672.1 hypothetical protein QEN48_01295 [Methanonatronarchaeum sp. AMET-Sl]
MSQDLVSLYNELCREVAVEEERIGEMLDSDVYGVSGLLERPGRTWSSGMKSLRSEVVVPVYECYLGCELPREVYRSLVGFDAYINSLDDIIDTRDLDKQLKVELTANIAFSGMMAFIELDEMNSQIRKMTIKYLSELFQIPMVERKTIEQIQRTQDTQKIIEQSTKLYRYRARDIDWFSKLPAQKLDIKNQNKIIKDLRNYRAAELTIKDIKDIPRDLKDQTTTPIIEITKKHPQPEKTIQKIHKNLKNYSNSKYKKILKNKTPTQKIPQLLQKNKKHLKNHNN